MFRFTSLIALLLFVLMFTLPAAAQEDELCTPEITNAVEQSAELCSGMERNSVCYGNNLIEAIQRTAASTSPFETPGDKIPLTELEALDLSGYNPETEEWGIAILTLQANLPDTLPGQGVTLILFGDVAIEDASEEDSDTAMQAIRFTSGIGQTECTAAPDGLLVQTPQGVASVQLNINGISVELGSTAFLHFEATEDGDPFLDFELLEGNATLQVEDGEPVEIEGGFGVDIPVDADGMAAAQPSEPEPLTETDEAMALLALMPEEVVLPGSTAGTGVLPLAGTYQVTVLSHTNDDGCPQAMVDTMLGFLNRPVTLTPANVQRLEETGELYMGGGSEPTPIFTIIDEKTIEATFEGTMPPDNCTITINVRGEWSGE